MRPRSLPFLVLACFVTAGALNPSVGCSNAGYLQSGSYDLTVTDPKLGSVERSFMLDAPSPNKSGPLPLLLYYHGQFGSSSNAANNLNFGTLGAENGFVTAYPQGMDDSEGLLPVCGTGWNTEAKQNASLDGTCSPRSAFFSCCYKSCRKLGVCTGNGIFSNCQWSTCYDDVFFTDQMIDYIGQQSCIDLDSVFITGVSNGGMLSWRIAAELTHKIAAFLPCFGLPLIGRLDVPKRLSGVPLLLLHGRQDRIIPGDGSLSSEGWYYVTDDQAVEAVAAVHHCSGSATKFVTPHDGGSQNIECTGYSDCTSGGLAVKCLYDAGHALPADHIGEKLIWWFLKNHVLSSAYSNFQNVSVV